MAYKIAIIVGSLRKDSLNRKVARSICAIRNDNLDCSMIEIGDLPLYNQDLDGGPPPQWSRFREQVGSADGVLFVSPEYNRGIPGVLKNAIDVGSRPYGQSVFDKKPGAIVTVSPGSIGGFGANHQIRQAAVFLNMVLRLTVLHPIAIPATTGAADIFCGCPGDSKLPISRQHGPLELTRLSTAVLHSFSWDGQLSEMPV